MKKASWLKYLILILLIIGFLVLDKYIYYKAFSTLDIAPISFLAFPFLTLLNIAIGVLIGLEPLFKEAKKEGRWKFNWLRALILLLPTLYLIIVFTGIIYGRIYFRPIMFIYKHQLFNTAMDILSIIRLLFGYWLVTSFYKNSETAPQITTENEP